MSHLKERKEKICLNCKAELYGRFCHVCGQENLEPKETVWHLVQHFFNDITHFDGKFFETVKYLLRRPGFLSTEYMLGRRMTYLNPIRMYVFTSAIFFIILFSLKSPEEMGAVKRERGQTLTALITRRDDEAKELVMAKDSDDIDDYHTSMNKLSIEITAIRRQYGDSTKKKFSRPELDNMVMAAYADSLNRSDLSKAEKERFNEALKILSNPVSGSDFFGFKQGRYSSVEEYDSSERATPDSLRDGWFKTKIMHRLIENQEVYREDPARYKEHFIENMLHSFPKILFWSLPIFAMILNILYFRQKKTYYYVDHGIFTIHVYCATFILILIMLLLGKISDWLQWGWFQVVNNILIFGVALYMLIYLYKAMRGFYRQGRAKTFTKYFIVCCAAAIVNLILLIIFFVLSAITV